MHDEHPTGETMMQKKLTMEYLHYWRRLLLFNCGCINAEFWKGFKFARQIMLK